MRTKLFVTFFVVILIALVSNLIFKQLIISDFDEYVLGEREDRLYWVLAAVEGSYTTKGWNDMSLRHSLHWATMLGFDIEVQGMAGETVLASRTALDTLLPATKRRMAGLNHPQRPQGEFENYPMFMSGHEIGRLRVRPLVSEGLLRKKEAMFKKRGRDFLLISFLVAGGGAVLLSIVFSFFLARPVKRLKLAAEAVAAGDLNVSVKVGSNDEIGRLTRTFNKMVEALRREEALRTHLTSNIAHELRTPLAVIKANMEAIEDGVATSPEAGLDTIRSEVERLITLIQGIEDVTKAEASFFKAAQFETISIRKLLEGVVHGMGPLFASKGLKLHLARNIDFKVSTDIEKLETIIRNILTNALGNTEHGEVRVDFGLLGESFSITVTDTGRGIHEAELPRIFSRFHKGEHSVGVGLGLAIVQELVEAMQGKVGVESTPGKGSAFKVVFPRSEG